MTTNNIPGVVAVGLLVTVLLFLLYRFWRIVRAESCDVCRNRIAVLQLGERQLCQHCWEQLDRYRNIERGTASDLADTEIRAYRP